MRASDWTLLVIAEAEGQYLEPVQLQKALFLIGKQAHADLGADQFYEFMPYDYGPFCRDVYSDAERLAAMGLVRIETARYKRFSATEEGSQRAAALRDRLTANAQDYLRKVVSFVRDLSFNDLVKAIYRAYPEMKEKSVFKEI